MADVKDILENPHLTDTVNAMLASAPLDEEYGFTEPFMRSGEVDWSAVHWQLGFLRDNADRVPRWYYKLKVHRFIRLAHWSEQPLGETLTEAALELIDARSAMPKKHRDAAAFILAAEHWCHNPEAGFRQIANAAETNPANVLAWMGRRAGTVNWQDRNCPYRGNWLLQFICEHADLPDEQKRAMTAAFLNKFYPED